MPNVLVGQHDTRQVAHDLMHSHQDAPGILLVKSNRLFDKAISQRDR
jgi:hypothetical protein